MLAGRLIFSSTFYARRGNYPVALAFTCESHRLEPVHDPQVPCVCEKENAGVFPFFCIFVCVDMKASCGYITVLLFVGAFVFGIWFSLLVFFLPAFSLSLSLSLYFLISTILNSLFFLLSLTCTHITAGSAHLRDLRAPSRSQFGGRPRRGARAMPSVRRSWQVGGQELLDEVCSADWVSERVQIGWCVV